MKNNQPKGDLTFYSTRGILLMIIAVLALAIIALIGMYLLGIISLPSFITNIIDTPDVNTAAPLAANISPESEKAEFKETIPRDEYASALAGIIMPSEYYQRYSISISLGERTMTSEYTAIYDNGNWWIQEKDGDVILSTTICKDNMVQIYDNTNNSFVTDSTDSISFAEYSGYLPLKELVNIIYSLTNDEAVDYASGITDYSLSFTPARGGGESFFTFQFKRKDGFSEEYTFSFENATIVSASKFNKSGEKIYHMEMKDSRNNITDFDVESLFVLK